MSRRLVTSMAALIAVRALRGRKGSPRGSRGALAAALALWAVLGPPPSAGLAANHESATGPTVKTVKITAFGEFKKAAQDAAERRFVLVRQGTDLPAVPGIVFGVKGQLEGTPAHAPVVLEVRVQPPADPAFPSRLAPGSRLLAATLGRPFQALYALAFDWEPRGVWTMELLHDGRKLYEKTFELAPVLAVEPGQATPASPDGSPEPPSKADAGGKDAPSEAVPVGPAAPAEAPSTPASPSPPSRDPEPSPAQVAVPPSEPAKTTPSAPAPVNAVKPPNGEKRPERSGEPARTAGVKTVYALQTGLFSRKDNAARQAASLRRQGFAPRVLVEGQGAGRRFRVVIDHFPNKAEALRARERLEASGRAETIVKALPSAVFSESDARR